MKILTANEAKTNFGEMLLQVNQSPVQITRNGKPVAVVISNEEFEMLEELKHQMLLAQIAASQQDINDGRIIEGSKVFDKLLKR